jgi:hypothetical protein
MRGQSSESRLQGLIHSLEQGGLAPVFRRLLLAAAVVGIALAYLLIQFKGLSSAEGMDQAQIAREVVAGHGFSTKVIRPLVVAEFEKTKSKIPDILPDTYHAPLHPLMNAAVLTLFRGALTAPLDANHPIFAGDRVIAAVGSIFFILSLVVTYFIGCRLFDSRVALIGCALALLSDQLWQFSLSGLPQMLILFLFSCAAWCLVAAMQAPEGRQARYLVLLGILLGLMALSHAATLWIAAGAILFCGLHFRWRIRAALIPLLICLGLFSIWIVRDYAVSKTPFGISPIAFLDNDLLTGGSWMREAAPDYSTISFPTVRHRILDELRNQAGSLYLLLGGIIVAPVFFVSLLHRFKQSWTAHFRWALLLMWGLAFLGSALLGINGKSVHANQFNILFGPLMALYGVALIFVLWSRLDLPSFVRPVLVGALILVSTFPPLLGFLFRDVRIQFPPYVPAFMRLFSEWTTPNEVICSDMPWAIAWYSDRKSVWLPSKVQDFFKYGSEESAGGPIVGLYLTPVSRDTGLASGIVTGKYSNWAGLIVPLPDAVEKFPFKAHLAIADNQCLYYSDRERWKR